MNNLNLLPLYIIPITILTILIIGFYHDIKVYDLFIEGVKEGIDIIISIFPPIIGLLVAIGVFRVSGALDFILLILKPITSLLHVPKEVVPLMLLRPLSGSASLAVVADMFKVYGPDSYIGKVISTMMGSTETIIYTLTVYLGSVGIKKIRYTLLVALIAELVSVLVSVCICKYI